MWPREFCRCMIVSGLTILSFLLGDYLGDKIAGWEALLELSRKVLGGVGYWIIHTANAWLGWVLASLVLFYIQRLCFPELYLDEEE